MKSNLLLSNVKKVSTKYLPRKIQGSNKNATALLEPMTLLPSATFIQQFVNGAHRLHRSALPFLETFFFQCLLITLTV